MTTRRQSQLTIGYSPVWKRQSAWDVPLANADCTKAFPATSRNYIEIEDDTEDVDDCTGEDFLFEILSSQRAKLNLDFDVDPDLLAGIVALAEGVAGSPTGGTSEVQTETMTATGGTRTLTVQVGADAQTTTPLAFDADAAAIQAAIQALSNVGAGAILVTSTGPFIYTFAAGLAKQDVNLITVNTFGLTGGTSVMVPTTPGVGLLHTINRITGYTLPLTSFYVGFRGSDKPAVIFKNVVADSIRVRSTARNKVTATLSLIGSAELLDSTSYTMPPCNDILPIRFGECQMLVGGVDYIGQNLGREFEWYYQNNVNPIFDGAAVYATRHERADKRPCGFNFFILGEPGDSNFILAKGRPTIDVGLRLGPAGRNVKLLAPQGFLKLASPAIRFGGDPSESEIGFVVRPKKVTGQSNTPTYATANTGQATAYLVSA